MLSNTECKKYIRNNKYSDRQIEEIKTQLYQVAELLVSDYIKKEFKNTAKKILI